MEISNNNNLIPTLSATDSPSQLSDGNPQPKSAKKKVPGEESSFDGTLATTLVAPKAKAPDPKTLGTTEQVELSAKGKAVAANTAKAEGGAPAPTIASLFQAKSQQSANGPKTSAFVAGPDQPWGSHWVYEGANQPAPEEIEAVRTAGSKPTPAKGELNLDQVKKLVEMSKAQGGDGSQLKQAAESTLNEIDSAIASVGGQIEGMSTNQPGKNLVDAEGNPVKATPNVLGGAEFISALQGARAGAGGTQTGNGGGLVGRANGRTPLTGVNGGLAQAKGGVDFDPAMLESGPMSGSAVTRQNAVQPNLQLISGGLVGSNAEGGHLEGGTRLAKDEPKLQTETFYPNGMPLTAAGRPGESLGAAGPQTITGHVVPGEMMRDRLTSESLRNVSNGISGMIPNGGGEMRIKMNPGNLGELMIRVTTNGKDVGLKVQANDPAAKKVIEESLGALRDSLATQSLALGRVDVTVATHSAGNSDLGQNSQQSPNGQHQMFSGFDGQSGGQNRSMDGFLGGRDDRSSRSSNGGSDGSVSRGVSARIAAMNSTGSSARAADSSRLDVMA